MEVENPSQPLAHDAQADIRRQIGLLGFVFLWLLGFPLGGLPKTEHIEGKLMYLSFPPALWKVKVIDNYWVLVYRAPNAFHRGMQRLCFGVRWYCLV